MDSITMLPLNPFKTTFKDGVKELIALFCSARVLCDKLGQSAAVILL